MNYAGFWVRFSATVWDWIILALPTFALQIFVYLIGELNALYYLISLLVIGLTIYMDGILGGTPGKLLLGLRIVDSKGNYVGVVIAFLRYIGKFVSTLIFGFGFLMIAWEEKKQGLHDRIASTYVIRTSVRRRWLEVIGIILGFLIPILLIGGLIYFIMVLEEGNLQNPFLQPKPTFNETLPIKDASIGLQVGNRCVPVDNYDFVYEDTACFSFSKIGQLEKNKNGSYQFDMGVWLYDANGNMTGSWDGLIGDEGKLKSTDILIKNGILQEYTLQLLLDKLISSQKAGRYTIEIAVYDKISDKGTFVNWTINMLSNYSEGLKIGDATWGVVPEYGGCESKQTLEYTQEEHMCVHPLEVWPFAENNQGLSIYDMDTVIRNESDEIVFNYNGTYRDDVSSIVALSDSILSPSPDESVGIQTRLDDLPVGKYTYELIVNDRLGKKQAHTKVPFQIIEYREPINVDSYVFGVHDGEYCIDRPSKVFAPTESVCIMPTVSGFEMDSNRYAHFNMDQYITDGTGDYGYYGANEFGDTGELEWELPVSGYYVHSPLEGFARGQYDYEVTVKDLIGGTFSTIDEQFTVK